MIALSLWWILTPDNPDSLSTFLAVSVHYRTVPLVTLVADECMCARVTHCQCQWHWGRFHLTSLCPKWSTKKFEVSPQLSLLRLQDHLPTLSDWVCVCACMNTIMCPVRQVMFATCCMSFLARQDRLKCSAGLKRGLKEGGATAYLFQTLTGGQSPGKRPQESCAVCSKMASMTTGTLYEWKLKACVK